MSEKWKHQSLLGQIYALVFFWVLTINFPLFQDNKMDFLEYVAAINLVLRGKLEDKLRWSFKVFDSDDNGQLDRNELRKIVKVRKIYS